MRADRNKLSKQCSKLLSQTRQHLHRGFEHPLECMDTFQVLTSRPNYKHRPNTAPEGHSSISQFFISHNSLYSIIHNYYIHVCMIKPYLLLLQRIIPVVYLVSSPFIMLSLSLSLLLAQQFFWSSAVHA